MTRRTEAVDLRAKVQRLERLVRVQAELLERLDANQGSPHVADLREQTPPPDRIERGNNGNSGGTQ